MQWNYISQKFANLVFFSPVGMQNHQLCVNIDWEKTKQTKIMNIQTHKTHHTRPNLKDVVIDNITNNLF